MSGPVKRGALPPSNVVRNYAALVGGPDRVREIIALSLREGTLQARSAHRWISHETSLLDAWKNEPNKDDFPKLKTYDSSHRIRQSDWQKSIACADDVALWDFRRSRLHVTIAQNPTKRIMFRDIRFSVNDIRAIFNFTLTVSKSNFHRANKIDEWRRFWHEMIIMAAQGRAGIQHSVLKEFSKDEDLVDEVRKRMGIVDQVTDEILSEDLVSAENIAKSLSFSLSEHSIAQEVKALRQALNLKRSYMTRQHRPALTSIQTSGSAGRTK